MVRPGATLGDIGHAIQSYVGNGLQRSCGSIHGHGVGQEMHEEPQQCTTASRVKAPCCERDGFTIEPMVNQG